RSSPSDPPQEECSTNESPVRRTVCRASSNSDPPTRQIFREKFLSQAPRIPNYPRTRLVEYQDGQTTGERRPSSCRRWRAEVIADDGEPTNCHRQGRPHTEHWPGR